MEAHGVVTEGCSAPSGFDADQKDTGFVDEGVEHADGVAAAADTSEHRIGQPILSLKNLAQSLLANDAVEVADHDGIRMRSERGTQQVVGGRDVRNPIAHGFTDGVLKGAAAVSDGDNFRAE